jgi:hypothetical protein
VRDQSATLPCLCRPKITEGGARRVDVARREASRLSARNAGQSESPRNPRAAT